MKRAALLTVLTCTGGVALWICYMTGLKRGHELGTLEGGAAVRHTQAAQKKAALELIRSGNVENGSAYLDRSLDKDILEIAAELRRLSPSSQARSNSIGYLELLAKYRKKYPTPRDADQSAVFETSHDKMRQQVEEIVAGYAKGE